MQQQMRFQVYMKPPLEMKARDLLARFVARILKGGHVSKWDIIHGANDFNEQYGLNNQIIIEITSTHFKMIREAIEAKLTNLKQLGHISFWRVSYRTITEAEIIFTEKRITQFPELLKVPSPAKPAHLGPFFHRKSETFVKKVATYEPQEKKSTQEKESTKEKKSKKPKRYLTANEAFWLEPAELKKLREEFNVILV